MRKMWTGEAIVLPEQTVGYKAGRLKRTLWTRGQHAADVIFEAYKNTTDESEYHTLSVQYANMVAKWQRETGRQVADLHPYIIGGSKRYKSGFARSVEV